VAADRWTSRSRAREPSCCPPRRVPRHPTIATIASALVGSNKLLGVLPLGTFNYFARRLNIPLELDGALEIVSTGRPTPVDVGELNGHLFLNNASIGFYAAQLQRREQIYGMLGRRQALAYLSGALALVQRPALFNLQIDLNGIRMSRRTPLLFVGNNDYQMDTFGIPGRECARGGHFATYITRPLPLLSLWGLAFRAIFRGLYGARGLEVICARELRVDLRRPRVRVALDGELKTLAPPLLFQRRIGGLVVLAPPESPR
jgi:diacylglycerol kinase family enzyme